MAQQVATLSSTVINRLDRDYAFIDLEVNQDKRIYSLGLVAPPTTRSYAEGELHHGYAALGALHARHVSACGHNFRRFDHAYLIAQRPELQNWPIIDTLELSLLVSPLQASHRLTKEYKPSDYARNNPCEDALATRALLHAILDTLLTLPQPALHLYTWLLSCGSETSDAAYQHLFFDVLDVPRSPAGHAPTVSDLPEFVSIGLDRAAVQQLLQQAPDLPFDTRLCLAALLAWNGACVQQRVQRAYAAWLAHQPVFLALLRALRPLQPEGFTYHTCLEYFDVQSFRPPQEEAVRSILAGERPLVLMPTGGGKSLCFQLPALMLHARQTALTVVISPLQALMEDQVTDLENAGLSFATFINATLSAQDRQRRLQQLHDGSKGLLYISPEQLRSISIRTLFRERPPAFWVVDEAHCISQWGHDFRPDYLYIPKFIHELSAERQAEPPLMALVTATATKAVIEDIQQIFAAEELPIGQVITSPTARRDNLRYDVVPAGANKEQAILSLVRDILNESSGPSGTSGTSGSVLIYTTTRKKAEALSTLLNNAGIASRHYHGKLPRDEKREVLAHFKDTSLQVVVATCAFGMGINRPDVRAVIHHTMSANLEGYTQESGRAGRDTLPALCTLLFDERDAETIFFLQSLTRLSEADLRTIFLATRAVRDRVHKGASEEWFWATTSDITVEAKFDNDFASDQEQRDTKMKVALHYLERFGMIERAENQSTYIQFNLVHAGPQASLDQFRLYSQTHQIPEWQRERFERLIVALHTVTVRAERSDDPFPLDVLSDASGIEAKELTTCIRELESAQVCNVNVPLTLLVTKDVAGAARPKHERLRTLERDLLALIRRVQDETADETPQVQLHLRGVATELDPENTRQIGSRDVLGVLTGWEAQRWLTLQRVSRDVVRLGQIAVDDYVDAHRARASAVIDLLYTRLGDLRGARLPVRYELGQLLHDVNRQLPQLATSTEDLEAVLLWLHEQKALRIADGLALFRHALKLRVLRGANVATPARRYSEVQQHYEEQTHKTHVMIHYGKISDPVERLRFNDDYFHLDADTFAQRYPTLAGDESRRPVTQADYTRIMGPLNEVQRAIVVEEHPALAVIAGPGSGKTRTILHRIAYLTQVKRVDPARILVLAYNRNAVRDIRIRLHQLIGEQAMRVRVSTFHGLALALLGRTVDQRRHHPRDETDSEFADILERACDQLEHGVSHEEEDENSQMRRLQLVGDVEYLFVDEYQDVDATMYRMIRLVAGLGASEDPARRVQVNLCIIGDDDQAIYGFRGASPRYLLNFEAEYAAIRSFLTENYRSTEAIIEAANALIQHNVERVKRAPHEQVRIDTARRGTTGTPVQAIVVPNRSAQAAWVSQRVQQWLRQGTPAQEIAILSRRWKGLNGVRVLLETAGIATQSLASEGHSLTKNLATCKLLADLEPQRSRVLSPETSVYGVFSEQLAALGHNPSEPTVKKLLKIGQDLDRERGFGDEQLALPISVDEMILALYEYGESPDVSHDEEAVLVTTCHGAKGLEFRRVIVLTDDFSAIASQVEEERRLMYVAMTRAKDELVLCGTDAGNFLAETGTTVQPWEAADEVVPVLPALMVYLDVTPKGVVLSHRDSIDQQATICQLREGMPLQISATIRGEGWQIRTAGGLGIGELSRRATAELASYGVLPHRFDWHPEDVTVGGIYRHMKHDDVTGAVLEDHFVVLPHIRLCR